jgi:hypothetical protein
MRVLFEADVFWQLGAAGRARGLYQKADPTGACPERLVAAYMASGGNGAKLFEELEALRKGDMAALRAAIDRVYLKAGGSAGDPVFALELYETAKKANPQGVMADEVEVVELLKMAVVPEPLDLEAFLKRYDLSEGEPYFLWKLAEEASAGGRFGKPDPQLVLQLVVRGPGTLGERLSAVRAAHANWIGKSGAVFEHKKHVVPPTRDGAAGKDQAEKEDYELKEEEREREFQATFKRIQIVFEDPRVLDLDLKGVNGIVCSEDGNLRIASWDTQTGGTAREYCVMAQFRSRDGKPGFAVLGSPDHVEKAALAIFGDVNRIDTIVTDAGESVYLVWCHAKSSTFRWSDGVAAVRLKSGRMEGVPFFQTKKALLENIQITYGGEAEEAGAEFRLLKEKGYTFLVPVISERYQFSGRFFKYVFDGKRFGYTGIQ